MIPTVERWALLGLLSLSRWPAQWLGRIFVVGEPAWQRVVPLMTPTERVYVAGRLGRWAALAGTPQGQEKCEWWRAARRAGRYGREALAARHDRIQRTLQFFGDVAVLPAVVQGLTALPEPVERYVLDHVMVLASGRTSGGWTGPMLPTRMPILIAGHHSDTYVRFIIAHEAGHVWAGPNRIGMTLLTAQEHATVLTSVVGDVERAVIEKEESLVRLLTIAWLCGASQPVA